MSALIDFVLSQLPSVPARVLEVGCGEGELARALAAAGYDVVAVDPEAPDGAIFRRTTIEDFDEPGPFDAVVASRSLHHVVDLGGVLDKLLELLAADGVLVLDEFAWDRREPMTREWESEHAGLHGYAAIRPELDARFDERLFEWRPYAVEGEHLPGLGFRYVGTARLRIRPVVDADVPALAELATRTWVDAFGDSVSAEDVAAEVEEMRSERYFRTAVHTDTILVAEADGELVGYAKFGDVRIPEVDAQAGDAGLHRVYVETGRQGAGIGRQLVRAALAHPRLRTAPRVYLQVWERNQAAVALYESFGFRTVGTTRVTIGATQVGEDLVMVLERK